MRHAKQSICDTTASPRSPHVAAVQQPGSFVRCSQAFIRRVNSIDSATGIDPSGRAGSAPIADRPQMCASWLGSASGDAAHPQNRSHRRQIKGQGHRSQGITGSP